MFAIVCQYAESVSFSPQFDLLMTAINSSYLKSFLEHMGEKLTGKVTFPIGRLFLDMISFESGSTAWTVVTANRGSCSCRLCAKPNKLPSPAEIGRSPSCTVSFQGIESIKMTSFLLDRVVMCVGND